MPNSLRTEVEMGLSAEPGLICTLCIDISLMYPVKYKGQLCLILPGRRSSLVKAIVALATF